MITKTLSSECSDPHQGGGNLFPLKKKLGCALPGPAIFFFLRIAISFLFEYNSGCPKEQQSVCHESEIIEYLDVKRKFL